MPFEISGFLQFLLSICWVCSMPLRDKSWLQLAPDHDLIGQIARVLACFQGLKILLFLSLLLLPFLSSTQKPEVWFHVEYFFFLTKKVQTNLNWIKLLYSISCVNYQMTLQPAHISGASLKWEWYTRWILFQRVGVST